MQQCQTTNATVRNRNRLALLLVPIAVTIVAYEIVWAARADGWYDVSILVSSETLPIERLWCSDTCFLLPGAELSGEQRDADLAGFKE